MTLLPSYVVINDPDCHNKEVLRQPAEPFSFPLSAEDLKIIQTLEAKFDAEASCYGLAAPQIGFNKQVIIFAIEYSEAQKKWRPDLTDTMSKTIWLNATYEPVGEEKHIDYEGCFSVSSLAGSVSRYKTIQYRAYLIDGTKVEGIVNGFLARLIQHEIDHINGILCIDLIPKESLITSEEYRRMRQEAMEKGR